MCAACWEKARLQWLAAASLPSAAPACLHAGATAALPLSNQSFARALLPSFPAAHHHALNQSMFAEGGDLLDHIPTPLLQPLLHLDSSDSEGSPTPTGASRAPSLPAPLADRLNSSSSSGSGGGFEGGAGGAVVLLRQPADSATSEVHVDLEAGAQLPDGGSAPAPIQRAVSEPMPIGQAGSHALPMLTPIM